MLDKAKKQKEPREPGAAQAADGRAGRAGRAAGCGDAAALGGARPGAFERLAVVRELEGARDVAVHGNGLDGGFSTFSTVLSRQDRSDRSQPQGRWLPIRGGISLALPGRGRAERPVADRRGKTGHRGCDPFV